MRTLLQRLLLAAGSVAVTLLVLELVIRVVAPQQLIFVNPDVWRPEEGIGYRHQENADTTVNLTGTAVRLPTWCADSRRTPRST